MREDGFWAVLEPRGRRERGREEGRAGGREHTYVVGAKEELAGEVALLDPIHIGHVDRPLQA